MGPVEVAGMMDARSETRRAAETYAIKIRWALIVAAGLLVGEQVQNPIVVGLLVLLVGSNFVAFRLAKDADLYERKGHTWLLALRLIDGLLVTGASFIPKMADNNLWALSIPILLGHAIVSRSVSKVASFAAVLTCAQLAGALALNKPLSQVTLSVGVVVGGALLAVVLAWFQTRDEVLSARDRRLRTVLSCGSALGANSNLRQTILTTLRSAILETRANCGYVMLFSEDDKEQLVTEAAYSEDGDFAFPERMAVGEGLSGYVARMGQPIAVSADDAGSPDFDGLTTEIRAAVSVPLITRGFGGGSQSTAEQVLGVMTLLDVNNAQAFPSEDMELLQALCSLLAVAVSNAKMEERRRSTFLRTLESLATALEARDEYTRGHSQRVCELSLMVGERMGFGAEALEELRVGTILHDIGKIGVPDEILNKRGRLTDEEFIVMRQHPVIGYEICRPLMLSEGVLMIIRNHHEKLDGTGYPDGLKGGELPLSLRIVCTVDAFDAMSSRRPYREVMDPLHVQAELSKGAGTQFDPVVIETLRELLPTERVKQLYRSHWEPQSESNAA